MLGKPARQKALTAYAITSLFPHLPEFVVCADVVDRLIVAFFGNLGLVLWFSVRTVSRLKRRLLR